MHLLKTYNSYLKNQISEEETAAQLKVSVTVFRFAQTKYGRRFKTLLRTLDGISNDTITREEASDILGVDVRTVNAIMTTYGVRRPIGSRTVIRASSKIKWDLRKKFAIDWLGGMDLEEAGNAAGCHPRNLRRWGAALLKKHYQMPYSDFVKLNPRDKRAIADEIDKQEGLEYEKKVALNEISVRRIDLKEEARVRLESLRVRSKGRKRNV